MKKIRDEKFHSDINRAAAKLSALSSGKIDKYEYLKGEEIFLLQQHRIIKNAKKTFRNVRRHLKNKEKQLNNRGKTN